VPVAGAPVTHALAPALRERLARKGASFFLDLIEQKSFEPVLEALWELVWAGEVIADSFLPLRGWLNGKSGSKRSRRLAARVPAPAVGRWELAVERAPDTPALDAAERLLERHGVLARDAALAEGVAGGFAALYPAL